MSYPGEGLELTTNSNCAEDVRALLESKHHSNHYSVYNVSRRSYPNARIGKGRVSEGFIRGSIVVVFFSISVLVSVGRL